jgi:hypothetical protein
MKIHDKLYEMLFGDPCILRRIKANLNLQHPIFKNKSFPTVKELMLLTFDLSNENIVALARIFPELEHLIITVQKSNLEVVESQTRFLKAMLRGCKLEICF